MIDLTQLGRRWGLPRCPEGDALQLPLGVRLVLWEGRLALYANDQHLVRRIWRGVPGSATEYASPSGGTLSFRLHDLGRVVEALEREHRA